MTRRKMSLDQLATEAGMDVDEALLRLWDDGFPAATGRHYTFPKREASRARRSLGLATRRELQSKEYWMQTLGLSSEHAFDKLLLEDLQLVRPVDGRRLRAKAIHRLQAERRRRILAHDPPPASPSVDPKRPYEPLQWRLVGHESDVVLLTPDQVCAIHGRLVDDFRETPDPLNPPGVRSDHLLESAVSRPATAIRGHRKYPTIEMATAALVHSLVHDHPFHNGNKRTALVAMLVSLDENGLMLTCSEVELFRLVMHLAHHKLTHGPRPELPDREVLAVAGWLEIHTRRVMKGDRPLAWRRLKQLLAEYGCEFENPTAGNRINILRTVQRPAGLFRSKRWETLRTQTAYAGDGTEAARNTVNKVRHDLELDDEHGIDSATFYDNQHVSQSEFIHKYRKTLRRLAKL